MSYTEIKPCDKKYYGDGVSGCGNCIRGLQEIKARLKEIKKNENRGEENRDTCTEDKS